MAKKLTRLEKSTAIISESKSTKWCYVNTENEFTFMNETFLIDNSVEEYKLHNKAGSVDNYTNEAYMEEILIAKSEDNGLRFYNQNYDEIDNRLVRIKD